MPSNKWDTRFLLLAKTVSTWSKDPSTRVGAVVVDRDHRIVSIGFNGFARGVKDDERLNDRATKYEMTVHAEINAILFAKTDLRDCTIYVWPLPPCGRCASVIIQSGISRVVAPVLTEIRWIESCLLGQRLLEEAGVQYFLNGESIKNEKI